MSADWVWEDSGKKLLRADLVRKVTGLGYSRRRAVELVNLVFGQLAEALSRGEKAECPFGYLEPVKRKRKPRRGFYLNRIITTYENPWTIVHVTDEKGQELLDDEDRLRTTETVLRIRLRRRPGYTPPRPLRGQPEIASRPTMHGRNKAAKEAEEKPPPRRRAVQLPPRPGRRGAAKISRLGVQS